MTTHWTLSWSLADRDLMPTFPQQERILAEEKLRTYSDRLGPKNAQPAESRRRGREGTKRRSEEGQGGLEEWVEELCPGGLLEGHCLRVQLAHHNLSAFQPSCSGDLRGFDVHYEQKVKRRLWSSERTRPGSQLQYLWSENNDSSI
ncbi:hypothetical protein DPEC_G00032090 [Dallia pectoralis]|uniref:Uncharacterized protein n=1 Tax=Dallia pectoralis TaxID=75939 RepID=A0ACC2HDW7_DALPE|nr:hypothetical protein DPEC_G00032090 [Dallia pectoralis]